MKKVLQIIPKVKEQYAYQGESVSTVCVLTGWIDLNQKGANQEAEKYSSYELRIDRQTGKSVTITLLKERKDVRKQRETTGESITHDCFQITMSFAEFVNAIFKDTEPFEFNREVHYPDSIREAFKTAYKE
ncbi:hypothetical protein GCM10027299_13510 [Larkinella ripae]